MIDSFCNGAFTSKIANSAWVFFEEVAGKMLEWEPITIDVEQPTTTTTTTNKGDMHRVNSSFDNEAKMTSVIRRLKALEKSKGAQFLASEPFKPVVSPVCVLCDSHDHSVEQCPGLPVIKSE